MVIQQFTSAPILQEPGPLNELPRPGQAPQYNWTVGWPSRAGHCLHSINRDVYERMCLSTPEIAALVSVREFAEGTACTAARLSQAHGHLQRLSRALPPRAQSTGPSFKGMEE